MKKGERYLCLCSGLAPALQGEWEGLPVQEESVKSSKKPFFCLSQQSPSALLPRGGQLVPAVCPGGGAGREGGEGHEVGGGEAPPANLHHLPPSCCCVLRGAPSPFLCVLKYPTPWM